ncbi:hypothetical protein SASPL_144826 [Salvia splendens]|uniref:Auxin-responsive protein n=1 Tax=Salvia splendens TaxID=180675 RepID=A0A8X8Z7I0_SALSN|nr:hypothetical protein SASPL_144826 [Salvia splendens]
MADAVMITKKLGFDVTELRLGLPSAKDKKRAFDETVDLKLNLDVPSDHTDFQGNNVNKTDSPKPPAKYAPLSLSSGGVAAGAVLPEKCDVGSEEERGGSALMKVSMDGAPYLRKVDLKMYKTYQELSDALGRMFSCFTIGMLDFMNGGSADTLRRRHQWRCRREGGIGVAFEFGNGARNGISESEGGVEIRSDEGLIKVLTELLMAALEDLSDNLVTTERNSSAEDCSDERSRFSIDVSL